MNELTKKECLNIPDCNFSKTALTIDEQIGHDEWQEIKKEKFKEEECFNVINAWGFKYKARTFASYRRS